MNAGRRLVLAVAATLAGVAPAASQARFVPSGPATVFGKPALHGFSAPPVKSESDLPSPGSLPEGTAPAGANADLAFGAYQRGFYATAMREALKRVTRNKADGPAMTLIGELYAQGLGIRADAREAARWYRLAGEAGDPQGLYALAQLDAAGDGVAPDKDAARALFQQAAAHDHPGALFTLGMMALRSEGASPDLKTARTYFARAAALGNAEAQYALAIMYRNGEGVAEDLPKAAALMKQAAGDDNIAAMVEYGIMLFNGIGVERDEAGAARTFLKAAARNNPVAQNRAARLLVLGRGIRQDVIEGMKWHILARSAGLKDAWLDSQLALLTPWQRTAVDNAVKAYVGS